MKKVLVVLLSLLMVVSVFAQKGASAPKGRVEADAKIRIGVDNDEWGAAIVDLWNKKYPRNKGALEYEYVGAAGATDYVGQLQGDAADVVLCIDGEVSRQAQSLLEMDKTIAKFENILNDSKQTISEMQNYVEELIQKSNQVDSQIKTKNSFIEECKRKLEPLFEELANFYKKQGIKVIKK